MRIHLKFRMRQTKERFALELDFACEVVDAEKQVFIQFHPIYPAKEQSLIINPLATFERGGALNLCPSHAARGQSYPTHISSDFSSG